MRCPRCGYNDEPRKQEVPAWALELRYLATSTKPLWSGLLEGERWRTDKDICDWLKRGWVRLIESEGFVITDAGQEWLKRAGLPG